MNDVAHPFNAPKPELVKGFSEVPLVEDLRNDFRVHGTTPQRSFVHIWTI